jgi:GNAT superfamily N-acetyltransferase
MWTPEAVLRTASEWIWIPHDAVKIETPELTMVVNPIGTARVLRFEDARLAEVVERGRAAGASKIEFAVHDHTRPADLGDQLLAAGATLTLELDVSALTLAAGWPLLQVPSDLEVVPVTSAARLPDVYAIDVAAFGDPYPTEAFRAADAALLTTEPNVRRFVVYADGTPVAAAGLTMDGPVGKLWGGGVIPAFRGRGAYRAVLAARLAHAAARGAQLALVKARTGTSAPILRRAGFTVYGREQQYSLAL